MEPLKPPTTPTKAPTKNNNTVVLRCKICALPRRESSSQGTNDAVQRPLNFWDTRVRRLASVLPCLLKRTKVQGSPPRRRTESGNSPASNILSANLKDFEAMTASLEECASPEISQEYGSNFSVCRYDQSRWPRFWRSVEARSWKLPMSSKKELTLWQSVGAKYRRLSDRH